MFHQNHQIPFYRFLEPLGGKSHAPDSNFASRGPIFFFCLPRVASAGIAKRFDLAKMPICPFLLSASLEPMILNFRCLFKVEVDDFQLPLSVFLTTSLRSTIFNFRCPFSFLTTGCDFQFPLSADYRLEVNDFQFTLSLFIEHT